MRRSTGPARARIEQAALNARLATGIVALLVGAVWIGQGLGYIPGSFMSGDPFWAAMGVLLAIAGGVLIALDRVRRGPRAD
jgi:F0F1-type ATP synthase assembly protein I